MTKEISIYTDEHDRRLRPVLVCMDGFSMSVQASHSHYCTPRQDYGPYSTVEVGYPSQEEELLMPYKQKYTNDLPENSVYGYVPVDVVAAVIIKHGGFAILGE